MTGPFHDHRRPPPDQQSFLECDSNRHLRGHDGRPVSSKDEGLERDGGEGCGIYVPFEARKGTGKGERTQDSISEPLDLSSSFAAERWPKDSETVRPLLNTV